MHVSWPSLQTPDMRKRKTIVTLGVSAGLIALLVNAAPLGQNEFARSLANLSNADRQAMTRARTEVLAKMQKGAVSFWKDDRTNHSGEARLTRTYAQNGMACAEVDHVLRLPRESHYRIPFCRDGTGTWRAAF